MTNRTDREMEITRLDIDMPYKPDGDWTPHRHRYNLHRKVAAGQTLRIPTLRPVTAPFPRWEAPTVRVDVTAQTADGEKTVKFLQRVTLQVDRSAPLRIPAAPRTDI